LRLLKLDKTLKEKAELLEGTNWLGSFTWKEIEIFARYVEVFRVQTGDSIFQEGGKDASLCLIVEGSVQIVKEDTETREKILSVITRGKTVGEMALFDGEPRSASAIAAESATIMMLTKDSFDRLIRELPGLAAKLLLVLGKLLSQRLRQTSGKLIDFI